VFAVQWAQFVQHFASGRVPPVLAEITRQVQQSGQESQQLVQQPDLLRQLEATPPSMRSALLLAYLQDEVVRVLGLTPSHKPDLQQGFFDMGMDSLMAIEMKSHLEASLGVALSSALIFEYPTVQDLARYLSKTVLGWKPSVAGKAELQPGENGQEAVLSKIQQLSSDEIEASVAQQITKLETLLVS
jgi:acyl carrier protein